MSDERADRLKAEMARQKAERKEKGKKYGNKDLLEVLGYSDLPRISEVLNGKIRLNDNQYQQLADHWGVRVEYLKCIDNFRTLDDMYAAAEAERTEYIESHLRYLESIGYVARPQLRMSVNHNVFEQLWPQIKPILTDEALNAPYEYSKYGYVSLADWENGKCHLISHACEDLPVKTTLSGSSTNDYHSDRFDLATDVKYTLNFVISKDGSPIATIPLKSMMNMFKRIDAHANVEFDIAAEPYPYRDIRQEKIDFINKFDIGFASYWKKIREQNGQQD